MEIFFDPTQLHQEQMQATMRSGAAGVPISYINGMYYLPPAVMALSSHGCSLEEVAIGEEGCYFPFFVEQKMDIDRIVFFATHNYPRSDINLNSYIYIRDDTPFISTPDIKINISFRPTSGKQEVLLDEPLSLDRKLYWIGFKRLKISCLVPSESTAFVATALENGLQHSFIGGRDGAAGLTRYSHMGNDIMRSYPLWQWRVAP